jgi:uncharacterized protein YbjT (DUF2867 family)
LKQVFVAGGTGYLGRPLIEKLCSNKFAVSAVVRPQSASKLPAECHWVPGDVLDSRTYRDRVPSGSVFVHLVGTPHPAPWKGRQFRSVDLVSLQQSVTVAKCAGASHFVFVSVAQPAPVMKAFIEVRMLCERAIRESGLNATILRPWYVLGPGHYWPYALIPVYRVLDAIPSTRASAERLGLVTRAQMVNALAAAVASNASGVRVVETREIRGSGVPE